MIPLSKTLALGAGCYWGTEKYVVKDFQNKFPGSIASASVGFMSPDPKAMKDPSYRQVGGTTNVLPFDSMRISSATVAHLLFHPFMINTGLFWHDWSH